MEDIKIPIDKQLEEFGNHILANPRTFLSSKFGDGKSYFLDKFKKRNAERFVFITLYPVNYQVANNEDITDPNYIYLNDTGAKDPYHKFNWEPPYDYANSYNLTYYSSE